MRQTYCLDQVFVPAQGARQRPADLRNFKRVGETGPKVVAFVVDEDLGLVFEPPKCCGVQDAVPIPLKGGTIFRFVIEIGTAF